MSKYHLSVISNVIWSLANSVVLLKLLSETGNFNVPWVAVVVVLQAALVSFVILTVNSSHDPQ